MSLARSKAVALALAAAILAVLAGCAAPDGSEKASFGTVVGTVVSRAGDPIANATVTITAATNYFGNPGPFTTNAQGRFVIDGLQVSANNPTTLKLQASAPGFVAAPVTRPVAGGGTTDTIVIDRQSITDVSATLDPAD